MALRKVYLSHSCCVSVTLKTWIEQVSEDKSEPADPLSRAMGISPGLDPRAARGTIPNPMGMATTALHPTVQDMDRLLFSPIR